MAGELWDATEDDRVPNIERLRDAADGDRIDGIFPDPPFDDEAQTLTWDELAMWATLKSGAPTGDRVPNKGAIEDNMILFPEDFDGDLDDSTCPGSGNCTACGGGIVNCVAVDLSWSNAGISDGKSIRRRCSGGDWVILTSSLSSGATTFRDTAAPVDELLEYAIRFNSFGKWSNPITVGTICII